MIVLYSPEYLPINGSVSFPIMMCYTHKSFYILIIGMLSSLSAQTLNLGGGVKGGLLIVYATNSPDLEFEHLD